MTCPFRFPYLTRSSSTYKIRKPSIIYSRDLRANSSNRGCINTRVFGSQVLRGASGPLALYLLKHISPKLESDINILKGSLGPLKLLRSTNKLTYAEYNITRVLQIFLLRKPALKNSPRLLSRCLHR